MGIFCVVAAVVFIVWAMVRGSGEKRITARYPGTCRQCERPFEPGVEIMWAKGIQPKHVNCEAQAKRLEAETMTNALERIEELKTASARKRAVREALGVIQDPTTRTQFVLRASRLETEAVLEKVAGLKTPLARKRHLTEALAALKQDDVADELQAAEIAALEAALMKEETT